MNSRSDATSVSVIATAPGPMLPYTVALGRTEGSCSHLRRTCHDRPLLIYETKRSRATRNGGSEIRTPETLAGLPVFKTGASNRSATPPRRGFRRLAAGNSADSVLAVGRARARR